MFVRLTLTSFELGIRLYIVSSGDKQHKPRVVEGVPTRRIGGWLELRLAVDLSVPVFYVLVGSNSLHEDRLCRWWPHRVVYPCASHVKDKVLYVVLIVQSSPSGTKGKVQSLHLHVKSLTSSCTCTCGRSEINEIT